MEIEADKAGEINKLISTIIDILKLRTPMSLTINFDGHDGYKLDAKLGHKAINTIITNKTELKWK